MNKKITALVLAMLMCLTTIIIPKNSIVSAFSGGTTLYVGGRTFGNYTYIQDAIDDATSGNTTIFVYNGTYFENLIIDKTINLTSESNDAIIDGNGEGSGVLIAADWVNLTGFTIMNGGNEAYDAGIKITSDHINISNNIIKDCDAQGMYLGEANNNMIFNDTFINIANTSTICLDNCSAYNTVKKNTITQGNCAIELGNGSHHNNLSENNINNNSYGIFLSMNNTNNNTIFRNIIANTTYNGVLLEGAVDSNIFENVFERNEIGLSIFDATTSRKNAIYHNNFINNTQQVNDDFNQTWDNGYPSGGNYWSDYAYGDNYSGDNQNTLGSDGIGDVQYDISCNLSGDRYPLMFAFGEYYPIARFAWSIQSKTASFNASISYDRDGIIVNWTWTFGDNSNGYGKTRDHTYSQYGAYNVTLKVTDNDGKNNTLPNYVVVGNDTQPPEIRSVSNSPETVGFGFNINISVNVTDNFGVDIVLANISYPNASYEYFTMTHTTGNMYKYEFTDTWRNGEYNYTIWAIDYSNNSNTSDKVNFTVSSKATIAVCTLKDNYGDNEYIKITDPPNPSENLTLVGRGLTWDKYYNTTSGCNVLEVSAGPINYQKNNGTWTPINNSLRQLTSDHPAYYYGYRTGNDRGLFGVYFKPDISNDWPVAFTYNRSDDPTTYVIRSKLVGVGYVDPQSDWAYQYLQSVQSSQGQTNGNSVTYANIFTGTDATWRYGNTELKEEIILSNATKTVLQNHPPSQYGLHDASSYLVFITKLDHQNLDIYNASGMLTGNITISDTGVDFKDALGYFKCALPLGEAYELNNESVRQKLTYRIVHLNGNTYLFSGLKVADLNAMTFPVIIDPTITKDSLFNDGYIYNRSTNYNTAWTALSGTISSSAQYITIGQQAASGTPSYKYIYRGFLLFNTSTIPSNVCITNATLSLYKKDDYSTTDFILTIQNGQPNCPHNPLQTKDYSKSSYSGNGGGFNTANFVNGRNNITLTNNNWITKNGTTKLCLRSSRDINGTTPTGSEYVNVFSANAPTENYVPKLIVIYRNQSKIKNTGSKNIKGYLLMQVQYYNTSNSTWVVDNDTVNETTPRTIDAGGQIGLDTIFDNHINTWNLSHGNGTYRVYAAFRDPDGNVLQINDSSFLNASYEFNVSMDHDSDNDGWTDYKEITFTHTNPYNSDTDGDGVIDSQDIDPLIDLKVTVHTKRIAASTYTYSWREGETKDWSKTITKLGAAGNNTKWVNLSDSRASGGKYTRQNDSRNGTGDFAQWNFTVLKAGEYYIWVRCHRYGYGCANINLTWNGQQFFEKKWDDKNPGYEIDWFQNTTNEWKWSWYGIVDMSTGAGHLRIANLEKQYARPGNTSDWMEVDNILITSDPNCVPEGKGVEGLKATTVGNNAYSFWDNGEGPGGLAPDFYVKTKIAGTWNQSQYWVDDYNVLADWNATVNVPDNTENIPITIELWEEDGVTDTLCDIGLHGKRCNITYDLRNATWWGDDYINDTDFMGRTCGEVDGSYSSCSDANVYFQVSQNDYDNDGITYWQETSPDGPYKNSISPLVKNDRYAVIVGAGAGRKVNQTSNIGSLVAPYRGTYLLYDHGSSWSDYTCYADLMTKELLLGDKEDIGVIFRYQNVNNYYLLRWEQNRMKDRMLLQKLVNGVSSNLDVKYVPLARYYWYTVKIVLSGSHIQVWVNDNRNDEWSQIFDINDNSFSYGGIALFSWRNEQAWYDDILVTNGDSDILLNEGFEFDKYEWSVVDDATGQSDWKLTSLSVDQEDFYVGPDFVVRELLMVGHYDSNNIYYLSAERRRDVDGDGNNDVTYISTKDSLKNAFYWLSDSSDHNDMNLIYIFDHGMNIGIRGDPPYNKKSLSYFMVDTNRNGAIELTDAIFSPATDRWIPNYNKISGIGRLTFIIEACFIGQFIDQVGGHPLQNRITITSTTWNTSSGGDTGQDWPAFSHMLFLSMANGRRDFAQAFNIADKYINVTNFLSIWCCWQKGAKVSTDSRLDDNGDKIGSNYELPNTKDGKLAGKTGL
jgi:nitrous oxidase accessory protein NosD